MMFSFLRIREDAWSDSLIDEIRRCDLVLFCGAGISLNSGIPIVSQIVPHILEILGVSKEHQSLIYYDDGSLALPFEAIIQILSEESLDELHKMYASAAFNYNHLFIARLAKAGYLTKIATTNFDELIEKAMTHLGVNYEVYHDYHTFDKAIFKPDTIQLFKLHGTISDKENIATTLRRVSNRHNNEKLKPILEYILDSGPNKSLLFVGYSGSDDFDINPISSQLTRDNKIKYVLNHSPGNTKIVDISKTSSRRSTVLNGSRGYKVSCDIDALMKQIELRLFGDNTETPLPHTENWQNIVHEWRRSIAKTKGESYLKILIAQIFLFIGEHRIAKSYCTLALSEIPSEVPSTNKAHYLSTAGICAMQIADLEEAELLFKQCIENLRPGDDDYLLGGSYSHLGIISSRKGNHNTAADYYMQAVEVWRRTKSELEIIKDIGNLGNTMRDLGMFKKAIEFHEEACSVARHHGDMKLQGNSLGNLGNAYLGIGDIDKSLNCFNEALEIAELIGDKHGKANRLCNRSYILLHKGDITSSIADLNLSNNLFSESGDLDGVFRANLNLLQIYLHLRQQEKLLEVLDALRILPLRKDQVKTINDVLQGGTL